jgi:two-component system OmpR family sensor kinase
LSLRLRLVLGLAVMLAAGLAVSGVLTYSFFAPSQYSGIDAQLHSSQLQVTAELEQKAGTGGRTGAGEPGGEPPVGQGEGGAGPGSDQDQGGPGGPGGPLPLVPAGTVGELISASGKVLASVEYGSSSTVRPSLPSPLPAFGPGGTLVTTGSQSGTTGWRVLLAGVPGVAGDVVAVAFPTTSVADSLERLVVIELGVASGLLVVLIAISWLILRGGLRPLEQMASTARTIKGGDLSPRVGPESGAREVVELGTALDTMLDGIEEAFAAREATERRLRQFLADASHELRTPLTSIQGFAELFRLGVANEHVDQETIVRRIEDEAKRMGRLVEDLLLLARLDQAPEPERRPVDLAVLAADACSDAVAAEPDRPVTLSAPTPVMVEGDEGHLRQAIANLVTNALRHTAGGTAIEVAAGVDGGRAVVSVRDHGEGLGEEALAHGFDRFWQADRARAGQGAGLGLAIVAAIAAEHGGTASAGNADGGGALFTLALPLPGASAQR